MPSNVIPHTYFRAMQALKHPEHAKSLNARDVAIALAAERARRQNPRAPLTITPTDNPGPEAA